MLATKGMRFPIDAILMCLRWYRAIDKQGKTIDFLLTAKRDKAAARRFFDKAMQARCS